MSNDNNDRDTLQQRCAKVKGNERECVDLAECLSSCSNWNAVSVCHSLFCLCARGGDLVLGLGWQTATLLLLLLN